VSEVVEPGKLIQRCRELALEIIANALYYANSRLRRYRRLKNTLAMLLPSVATE